MKDISIRIRDFRKRYQLRRLPIPKSLGLDAWNWNLVRDMALRFYEDPIIPTPDFTMYEYEIKYEYKTRFYGIDIRLK